MLRDSDLNLTKAIELGVADEESKKHAKEFATEQKSDKVNIGYPSKSPFLNRMITSCKFCSGSHVAGKCPAFGKKCNNCGKKNHFAKSCFKRTGVNEVMVDATTNVKPTNEDNDDFFIETITQINENLESLDDILEENTVCAIQNGM